MSVVYKDLLIRQFVLLSCELAFELEIGKYVCNLY